MAAWIFILWAAAAPFPTLCNGNDYERGLCAYRGGDFAQAAKMFAKVVEAATQDPQTIKAHYFLGRSLMKQRKWREASEQFVRIYGLSRAFYDEWNCDFLLGECRKAMGLG